MKQASHVKSGSLSRSRVLPAAGRVDPLLPARLAGKVNEQVEVFAFQMREGLLAASVAIGLDVMAELIEAEVTEVARLRKPVTELEKDVAFLGKVSASWQIHQSGAISVDGRGVRQLLYQPLCIAHFGGEKVSSPNFASNNDPRLIKKGLVLALNNHRKGEVVTPIEKIRRSIVIAKTIKSPLPEVSSRLSLQNYFTRTNGELLWRINPPTSLLPILSRLKSPLRECCRTWKVIGNNF